MRREALPIGTRWLKASRRAVAATAIIAVLALTGVAQANDATLRPAPSGGSPLPDCFPSLATGSQTVTIDTDGGPRDIIIHVPASATGQLLPAVVAFHGYTSFATDLETVSGLSVLADRDGFVVAYPQALDSPTQWHFEGYLGYDQRDSAMMRSLLPVLVEQACADPERIILAGHSMGGGMASDAACRMADQVAGVVLVSALWFELPCQPTRPVPVIAMHALDDPKLPYAGGPIGGSPPGNPEQLAVETAIGAWAAMDGCSPTPTISASDDGGAVLEWSDCRAPVRLYRHISGGHDWPAVASEVIAGMLASG